jgi:glycosyltransferase 2 family protein
VKRFLLHTRTGRASLVVPVVAALTALAIVRGPDVSGVGDGFRYVKWEWVAAAVLINLISVVFRSLAWGIVLREALPGTRLRQRSVFAAFCVGLLGNAALPGRVGELARVAVLSRRVRRPGAWATIVGTVFAHRMFDVLASVSLVVYTLYAARLPHWAVPGLAIVLGIGLGLLLGGLVLARRHHSRIDDEFGFFRRLLLLARQGLVVLGRPVPALGALLLQVLGWTAQLFAVAATFRAFNIHAPISAAALVLVLINLATVFPLWPGNIGLVQAAVALPLIQYGIRYPHGIAFGFGLQAIEASVGLGLGLLFLAREGFTFAMLKRMPEVTELEVDERVERIA